MATREDELRGFLQTLPDASRVRPAVPLRPRDIARPQPTMGAARAGSQFTPNLTPRGSAQELNPQRGASLADVADAVVPVRTAARLGYATARNLSEGNRGAAVRTALAAAPLAVPSATVERLLGPIGRKLLGSAAPAAEAAFARTTPEEFHSALSKFAAERPSEAGFITWRTPDEMRNEKMATYLSPDGKTGYAIHPESGDIRNVFNHGDKGGGAKAVASALNNGGKILDAFDTNLGNFYRDMGFKETWRSPWNEEYRPANWDAQKYGTPDVIGMEHPQAGRASEADLLSQYDQNRSARKTQMSGDQVKNWRSIQDFIANQNSARRSLMSDRGAMAAQPVVAPPNAYVRPGVDDMAIPASVKPY